MADGDLRRQPGDGGIQQGDLIAMRA